MSVREFNFIFILFASLFDIRSFDRRNSSGQERKFIYWTRVTREYQKHWISSRIQVRSAKNPKFRYCVLTVIIGRTKRQS